MNNGALLVAAKNGNTAEVGLLLANGANVNFTDNYGRSPLYWASENGHTDAIKMLLAKGADANVKNILEWTPLHWASRKGDTEVVEALLVKGAQVDSKDDYGRTPLHRAIKNGHREVVEMLLAKGADVNCKDRSGWTPLHWASDNGHTEVVKMLLAKGADINSKDNDGLTPLHRASYNRHMEVVEMLLAKGAIVNSKDERGWTPLHWASDNGHTEVVKMLLAKEADANVKNNDGWTPLHRASGNGHTEVVKMLLAKGAYVNNKDEYGWTPLHRTSDNGHTEVVKLLLAEGADVNSKNVIGWTPLHLASSNGHINLVKILLAKEGVNVNADNNIGATPLHVASEGGNADIAQALIVKGASCYAKNHDGKTALDIAKLKGVESIIKLLENARVKQMAPDVQNSSKPTATSQVHLLTNDDVLFLKKAKDGGDIPVISEAERSALQTLTTNMVHFENSLESVRELPLSLANKGSRVANYFFCFTSAFERTYTVVQVLNSGAVGVQSFEDRGMIEALLGGASWVAEKSNLPFVGCISIFSTIITHQRDTRKHNLFSAFEDFFSGNCRDQYLLTYRKLAEQFCLQLDISSLTKNREETIGKLKSRVNNKIIDPIRKHLRKVHLDTILRLHPVEEKAMSDLASITEEVLRLHQEEHHTYDHLRTSNKSVIASYFIERAFGEQSISSSPPQDVLNNSSTQTNAQDQLYNGSQVSTKNDGLDQLQHMKEKMFILEKQPDVNANMAKDLKDMQVQVRKLVAKVKSQKDLTVSGNHQAQMQINPNANMDETQQLLQSLKMKFAQYENDLHDVQRHLEKQNGDLAEIRFDKFISKRDLSVHEAFLFIEEILSMARDGNGKNSIVVSEEGRFSLNGKDRCIGAVNRNIIFSKTKKEKKLWKGRVRIKLEEEQEGVKSVMYWFDKTGLRPLYERNKKKAVHKLFAEELKD